VLDGCEPPPPLKMQVRVGLRDRPFCCPQCAHSVGGLQFVDGLAAPRINGLGEKPRSRQEGDDQLPHAPDVTVTSTVEAAGSLVTTSRVAPAAEVALPPITLGQ